MTLDEILKALKDSENAGCNITGEVVKQLGLILRAGKAMREAKTNQELHTAKSGWDEAVIGDDE